MANYKIDNAPRNLSMTNFSSVSSSYGTLAKSCRFLARINPVGQFVQKIASGIKEDLVYLCESTEFPGRGMTSIDVRYYGPSFKLPFQSTYEDLNMTFLCRDRSLERQFFDDWMSEINPISSFDFRYRDDYKCNVEIFHYTDQNNPSYAFTIMDAWPTVVNPQQVTWADDQFLRLGVTMTYHWWVKKGRDYESTKNLLVNLF